MSPQRATLVISLQRAALLAALALVLAPLPGPAVAQMWWPFGQPPSAPPHVQPSSGIQPVQLPSGVQTVALPPDADPAYSTPVDLDRDVDFDRTTRRVVRDPTGEAPGTLTINTRLRKLYLSLGDGQAMQYGIAVGRQGFAWKGVAEIGRKAYWPGWTPPPEMLERSPELPPHLDGGLDNPLGARALYLFQDNKDTLFRIHGTNDPKSIGHAVSSGCIRMLNADVIDLYSRVAKGTKVVVL